MFIYETMGSTTQLKAKGNLKHTPKMNMDDWRKNRLKELRAWKITHSVHGLPVDDLFSNVENVLGGIVDREDVQWEWFDHEEYHVIDKALDFFEQDHTNLLHQIWVLGVLRQFQLYHPTIDVQSIGKSDHQGESFSKVGLALALTKKFDLFSEMNKALKDKKGLNKCSDLAEALNRVELLHQIGKWNKKLDSTPQIQTFKDIYDGLLQESCPLDEEKTILLAQRCIEGIMMGEEKTEEVKWIEDILFHLYRFSHSAKNCIKHPQFAPPGSSKLNIAGYLTTARQQINRIIKIYESKLYISKTNADPFISNLLRPFTKDMPVPLEHYKYILDCFEAHEKVIYGSKDDNYRSSTRYLKGKRLVISVLFSESPYINGAQEYLASRLEKGDYFI
ncbi:hypothetical protein DFH28DRAFT_881784 [Melampsora americana]|nr:hypothetical protein DFH28DRAFT_881784 [Melampsora americana]